MHSQSEELEVASDHSCEDNFQLYHMPSIPIDVLREILEHVDKADLATLCRVNKIFCSCSQDVLYREIYHRDKRVIPTLARSTDLARRVRSFHTSGDHPEQATALRNMSSLRRLDLVGSDVSNLDGCTFKLDSFDTDFPYSEPLQKFLNNQPSLSEFVIHNSTGHPPPFEETFLPNLTLVMAKPSWVRMLIPGRPVGVVMVFDPWGEEDTIDLSVFTLSTAPIRKLRITYRMLYPTPGSHLASIFPSLEHLMIDTYGVNGTVRILPLYLSI
jgi:F-box domain